ncbi:MAG: ABC transporter ATP-binding protein [Nitrospirae bacterium]|nr:ABC transporter ATP-binding protein [Nitrospirota bacterium]
MDNSVINMKNVSWKNGYRYILKKINWTVKQKEHWVILGLNGSGKTSLLNLINGYIWPSKGTISVLGKTFGEYDIRQLRKSIGMVSSYLQEKFYTTETAEEIILSGKFATIGLYDRISSKDYKDVKKIMESLDCITVLRKPYCILSQGEKQKVLIARALINMPEILVFDEPLSGLDIFGRENLLSYIEQLGRKDNAPTIIYVTHRIEEILPVFTHILLLKNGEIYLQGKKKDILTNKNLSYFFETPVKISLHKNRFGLNFIS